MQSSTGADPRRILFFSHDAELYGASLSLVTLARGLQNKGIECQLVVPYAGPLLRHISMHELKVELINYPSWFIKASDDLRWISLMRRRLLFVARLARCLLNRRLFKLVRQADLIVTNTSAIPIGALTSWVWRRQHLWHIRELGELHYGFKYVLGKRLSFSLIGKTKCLVFNSEFVRAYFVSQLSGNGIRRVIYNGIFERRVFLTNRATYSEKRQVLRKDIFTFAIIGYIHAGKGQRQAVEAMIEISRQFKDVELLVVGNGETEDLIEFIQASGLESRVTLTGYLTDVNEVLLRTSCLLNCARFEAFGRTTVEAMGYGIPVIGRDSAGTAEIIKHGYSGLLYDGSTEDLVACMKEVIINRPLCDRLGLNGWKEAYEKYNIEQHVDSYYDLIQHEVDGLSVATQRTATV